MRWWGAAAAMPLVACHFYAEEPPLYCTEFKPGIEITGTIGGSARAQVAAQIASDVSAVVEVGVMNLTGACRRIAEAHGAAAADLAHADTEPDAKSRAEAMCMAGQP